MSTFKQALLLGALLISASTTVYAALYKWTDENGVTQYSQNPPPSGHYQEMQSPPPANDSGLEQAPMKASTAKPAPVTGAAGAAPPDDQKQAEQQQARAQNCQLAQQRLSGLENHGRTRYTAADGSVQVMGDDEKQAKIAETRQVIEDMCQ